MQNPASLPPIAGDQSPLTVEEIIERYPMNRSFSSLDFGKGLLVQSADLIQQSLMINQQYQPFDLSPQIQELLDSLEQIPHYFSWIRRFFYRLPIIGFYFSPLRHLDMIQSQVVRQMTTLNNLLKVQIIQLQQKISAITPLISRNAIARQETANYLNAGIQMQQLLSDQPPFQRTAKGLETQLNALRINQISLSQHAQQLEQSSMVLQHYLAEMTFINHSLFPLWQQQFKLIHEMVRVKAPVKIIHTETAPLITAGNKTITLTDREKQLAKLTKETSNNAQQNRFNFKSLQNIKQQTVKALELLL